MGALYLDASALTKLVLPEAETRALEALIGERMDLVSSEIALVEVHRATRRALDPAMAQERAREMFQSIGLVRLTEVMLYAAVDVYPVSLRTLDAMHVASALSLGSTLEAFIAYDLALARAAAVAGLKVLSPA